MGIAEKISAEPALTAVLVVLTGISGAIMVTTLMNGLQVARRVCSSKEAPRIAKGGADRLTADRRGVLCGAGR
jgi:hypothetical protein